MKTRDKLIHLFKMDGKPYLLSYEYRKKYSAYKEDLPILRELLKEKAIIINEKTPKIIVYQYIAEDNKATPSAAEKREYKTYDQYISEKGGMPFELQ